MPSLKRVLIVLVPLLALGACQQGLSDQDRALLTAANQNADQAKQMAQQAQTTANQAESDAKAANEKADRMYQRSLRK
jgi:Alanine-zipper, major outer membrane lipoprotein